MYGRRITFIYKNGFHGPPRRNTMGNIRPTYIKRVAIELVKKYPEEFSLDFQYNKEKVNEFTDVGSKMMRNRIAGYVTRYIQKKPL